MKIRNLCVLGSLFLGGCVVPEYETEIQTPRVSGAVYEQKTRRPISGASVAFVDRSEGRTVYRDQKLEKVSAVTGPDGRFVINETKWHYYAALVASCGTDYPEQKNDFDYLKISAPGYRDQFLYTKDTKWCTPTGGTMLKDYDNLKVSDVFLKRK